MVSSTPPTCDSTASQKCLVRESDRDSVLAPGNPGIDSADSAGRARLRGERPIEIVTDDRLVLDARIASPEGASRVVVLAHPHPLYGGSKDEPVTTALTRILAEHRAATLRFDFRGVGRSEGRHGGGPPEIHDLIAAVRTAARELPGLPISVVGYSFGSWVALQAARTHRVAIDRVAIVAPAATILRYDEMPPAGFGFDRAARFERPVAIALGDRDVFCDVPRARVLAARIGASIAVLSGEDHFFAKSRRRVAELLVPFLLGTRDRIDEGSVA